MREGGMYKNPGDVKAVKCPYCGSGDVVAEKSWEMPKMGYKVTHYRCRKCSGRFNHYTGRGREFVLRVMLRRGQTR